MTPAALLLLADGRLPSGGHAHSGGLEEAITSGSITDMPSLHGWLEGRLRTVGVVETAFAAKAVTYHEWLDLDAALAARTPCAALRAASRAQGRGLLRTARAAWPAPMLDDVAEQLTQGPFWPIALGATAAAAALDTRHAAVAAATITVTGPAWAATRLLGVSPLDVAALLARMAPVIEQVADRVSPRTRHDLPALSAPLLDLNGARHRTREVRLFAS